MNVQEFFTKLYYDNDILAMTDTNCFDYKNGKVDIDSVIQAIEDNNLQVICKFEFE